MSFQYTLQIQIKNGSPYIIGSFDSFDILLSILQEKINKDKHYRRPFYVYNNFFNNVYDESIAISKYKVFIRSCSDWEEYKDLNYFLNCA